MLISGISLSRIHQKFKQTLVNLTLALVMEHRFGQTQNNGISVSVTVVLEFGLISINGTLVLAMVQGHKQILGNSTLVLVIPLKHSITLTNGTFHSQIHQKFITISINGTSVSVTLLF